MREEVPDSGSGWPGRFIEVHHSFLCLYEHSESDEQFGHRSPTGHRDEVTERLGQLNRNGCTTRLRATTDEHSCSSRSHKPIVEQVECAHPKLGVSLSWLEGRWLGDRWLGRSQDQVSRNRLTAKAEPAAPITIPTRTTKATITVNSPLGTSRLVPWLGFEE